MYICNTFKYTFLLIYIIKKKKKKKYIYIYIYKQHYLQNVCFQYEHVEFMLWNRSVQTWS